MVLVTVREMQLGAVTGATTKEFEQFTVPPGPVTRAEKVEELVCEQLILELDQLVPEPLKVTARGLVKDTELAGPPEVVT